MTGVVSRTAARVRREVTALPRRSAVFLAGVFVALVVVPVALTAARSGSYSASVQAFPVQESFSRPPSDMAAYTRRLLDDPLVWQATAATVDFPFDAESGPNRFTTANASGTAVVTVRADSPDHARELADALAVQLSNASARERAIAGTAQLADLRRRLTSDDSGKQKHAALSERIRSLEAQLKQPRYGVVIGPRPSAPRATGAVDRLLDKLPGPLPPRPSLVWVALAGMLLTAFATAVTVVRVHPRGRERWLGAWLLPLSREERNDVLSFGAKFGHEHEERLALLLVRAKERDGRQWTAIVNEFAERFPPPAGKRSRVLVFGCGAGEEALLLAGAGHEVTVMDADDVVLEFVLNRFRRRELTANASVIDLDEPSVEGVFDAIFVAELQRPGLQRSLAAQALRGGLRPGAMLVEQRPRLTERRSERTYERSPAELELIR